MKYLIHSKGRLAYAKEGTGSEFVLVFHGFGQTHKDMLAFTSIRKSNQCLLLIDIFYHGASQWDNSSQNLGKETWAEIINLLQKQEGFTEFGLVGYSMGGKFSLITYELFPNQVKSLILLAPDGIKTGIWYSLNSYPGIFHPVFKRVVFKPKSFFGMVDGLNSAGMVEKSLVKFIKTQLETRSSRAQAYFVWKVFGSMLPHIDRIIRLAREHQTPITLFTGQYDKMVTQENLKKFTEKIPQINSINLPVGHGQLIGEAVEYLKKRNDPFE
ncbi:alpha/beta hydrolase [Algoriphagus litoralis]|uniref:alpha/beta hydrolase n=1 Tax=Algoriphagus litoralis TaxID=2202829 RepID=UPI000DB9E34B|nr:alpha/beta hydrolase [Algoriphagus litoralis]